MDTTIVIKQCEDYLFPALKLSVRERMLYYHLFRHTHLEGKSSATFSILPLANALGVAESSVRDDVRNLHKRGCIKIEDRSRNGHLVRVLLPDEIDNVLPKDNNMDTEVVIDDLDFFTSRRFLNALLARDDNRFFYCLKDIRAETCELDHVVSRAIGTDNSYRNIVCSCHGCNTTK